MLCPAKRLSFIKVVKWCIVIKEEICTGGEVVGRERGEKNGRGSDEIHYKG